MVTMDCPLSGTSENPLYKLYSPFYTYIFTALLFHARTLLSINSYTDEKRPLFRDWSLSFIQGHVISEIWFDKIRIFIMLIINIYGFKCSQFSACWLYMKVSYNRFYFLYDSYCCFLTFHSCDSKAVSSHTLFTCRKTVR